MELPYVEHPDFPVPADLGTMLWRYMDLARLVSLLSTSSLWLARSDTFSDPHEGAYGSYNAEMRPAMYDGVSIESLAQLSAFRELIRKQIFVNCWHSNPDESMAMWAQYARQGEGVAIRTTFEDLTQSLGGEVAIHAGRVTYVDPHTEWIPEGNLFHPYLHKRRSFAHEQEVRLVAMLDTEPAGANPLGFSAPTDISRLVHNVYVGPQQPAWFKEVVQSVVSTYLPGMKVAKADLDETPVF